MKFDIWFKKQDRLVKIILLIIPFVGYVTEILVRVSAFLRKQNASTLLGLILFVIPWGIILAYVDLIWVLLFNNLILAD